MTTRNAKIFRKVIAVIKFVKMCKFNLSNSGEFCATLYFRSDQGMFYILLQVNWKVVSDVFYFLKLEVVRKLAKKVT